MSGVYLIIVLIILNNISPELYLAIKDFIIRLINLDSSLLTEHLSNFARFMLSFYSSYKNKKYNPLEFADKPYYKCPPYLKDEAKNIEDTNKNLINIFSKENNFLLSSKNSNKVNINQVQPYQEKPYQEQPIQEQTNNNQVKPVQEKSKINQEKLKINQEKSKINQEQSNQQKTITEEIGIVIKNFIPEEVIKNFINLFPKQEQYKEDIGNKSVEEIRSELPKKIDYGIYKTYDVFDKKGKVILY